MRKGHHRNSEGSIADLKTDPKDKRLRTLVIYDMTGIVIQNISLDENNRLTGIEILDSSRKTTLQC